MLNLAPQSVSSEQTAIKVPGEEWTYGQLKDAIQIVRSQIPGCVPSNIVALLLSDYLWTTAAIFAVLAEGLTYLFLEPTAPKERLRKQIRSSSLILTDQQLLSFSHDLAFPDQVVLLLQTNGRASISQEPRAKETDAAALFYTSGSTGQPKGIFHSHANILKEIAIHTSTLKITSQDRLSGLYSLATVGANRDFYAALLNGAAYCPFPLKNEGVKALKEWINHCGITILHLVPAIYRRLMQTLSAGETFPSVRIVFLAGDRVSPNDVALFRQHFPSDALFYTGIGTSETCSLYAHWFVPRSWENITLPVGYAIPNSKIQIIDDKGNPASPGALGRIGVVSPTLGKFIETKQDIYMTGDEGWMDASGLLYFYGRQGEEIKRNGERINIAEIESLLRSYPGVREAAVCIFEGHLAAYLERNTNMASHREVQQNLTKHLSWNSIPSFFIDVEAMPLCPNGKIVKSKLPTPLIDHQKTSWTTAEVFIAGLLKQVLPEISIVSKDLSFKQLGGDSLAALELHVLLQKNGLNFSLQELLEQETIRSLAEKFENSEQEASKTGADPLKSSSSYWSRKLAGKMLPANVGVILGENHSNLMIWITHLEDENSCILLKELSKSYQLIIFPKDPLSHSACIEEGQLEQLSSVLLPYLQRAHSISLGGICASGKIAIFLAKHLQQQGFSIFHIYILDGYANRLTAFLVQNRGLYDGFKRLLKSSPYEMLKKVIKFLYSSRRSIRYSYIKEPQYVGMGTFFISEENKKSSQFWGSGWNGQGYRNWKRVYLKGYHHTYLKDDFEINLPLILKAFEDENESKSKISTDIQG
jgi:acyl-coenzyme A synthetase/AMP-(fatty) acid ligase/acyl carrier protein